MKQKLQKPVDQRPVCLVEVVAEAMKSDPGLRAVKLDRTRRAISLAVVGRTDSPDLERQLTEKLQAMEKTGPEPRCTLLDGATDCSACAFSPSERQLLQVVQEPGATTISRVTCPTAPHFWRWRDLPWPRWAPRKLSLPEEEDHAGEWKAQLAAAAACGVFALAAFFLRPTWASYGFYFAAYVAGAWFTVEEVSERLRQRVLDVHFLMLAVAAGSASIGAWGEGSVLLFLFSLSGALEHYAMHRTQREIHSLFKSAPKVATTLDDRGNEISRPVEELGPGMKLLIKPGEQFPVDAEVVRGETASDESNLTGEATAVEKKIGDHVLAGTLNLWGAVQVVVLRSAAQSSLQKIIHLIREAQHMKAPAQRFTDKFGTAYTYSILGASLVMFLVWWLGFGHAPFESRPAAPSAFYSAMTLLVVASPCALVLSIPSAVLAAIAWSARRGILFRGGAAVEKLAEINIVALDKTGTLTTGDLRVERIESFPPGREQEVAELACALEQLSAHPLARAISRYGKQRQLRIPPLDRFESVTGAGVRASSSEGQVRLGRREWVAGGDCAERVGSVAPADAGFTEVWLTRDDGLLGRVLLRDELRPAAAPLLKKLDRYGLSIVVLTGDRRAVGEALKNQLDLKDVRSELKPDEKVAAIASFMRDGRKVAMIGDGVNDAPSLAAAHVGVAMGARGSDAALEQADVVLMHDRLENFLAAYDMSRRARRVIRENMILSLGTVAALVLFAITGSIPLTVGVLGHEGSTVLVVLNSLRLLFGGQRAQGSASEPLDHPREVISGENTRPRV